MYVNVPLNTCEVQMFRELHQGDVIPASDPVEAFVGYDPAHAVRRVEQRVQWLHHPGVQCPVGRVRVPAGGRHSRGPGGGIRRNRPQMLIEEVR